MTDRELLAQYVGEGSGEAFAELVRRYVDLVYGVALRQVNDAHLAEDVAQAVFLILAEKAKAGRLGANVVLAGWLFRTARFVGGNANKREVRRRKREVAGMRMNPMESSGAAADRERETWESELAPVLDGALSKLGSGERDAVLLRFFQGMELPEVAAAMGVSVDAARKRIERGLGKLRRLLGAAGVVAPSVAALGAVLVGHGAVAAPAELAGSISAAVGASGAGAGAGVASAGAASLAEAALSVAAWANAKVAAVVVAIIVVGMATTVVVSQVVAQPVVQVPVPAKPQAAPAAPETAQIEGVIKAPDETPAAGAEVFVAMPEDPARRQAKVRQLQARALAGEQVLAEEWQRKEGAVAVYNQQWPAATQIADATGRFTYGGVKEPWVLVVRHASGYAEVSHDQFRKSNGLVWLAPWGRVEGTVRVGAEPQGRGRVVLFRGGPVENWDWEAAQVEHSRQTMTDATGKFVFENVCPGEAWLAWIPTPANFRRVGYTPARVDAGKTLVRDVGGSGRPVVGRAAVEAVDEPGRRISWAREKNRSASALYYDLRGSRPDKSYKLVPGWEGASRAEQIRIEKQWYQSPDGIERRRYSWAHEFDVGADGSFRIDDVTPGKYSARLVLYEVENGIREEVAECRAQFTVPELPQGVTRLDEPLDLGTLAVTLKPRLVIGQPARDFEATTIDGKPLRLSDYKGKYVLLKWWSGHNETEVEVAALKKAYQAMRKDGNWVLITVGLDQEPQATRKRVVDHQVPGIHCRVGEPPKHFPPEYLSSASTPIIVGPDGKVLVRSIPAVEAETAVAKVMLEKP